jgi:hypothetical protein
MTMEGPRSHGEVVRGLGGGGGGLTLYLNIKKNQKIKKIKKLKN